MTLTEAIQEASSVLKAVGFKNHLWQARILAAHVKGLSPGQLYSLYDLSFGDKALEETFFSLVKKRISGVPLQHITGEWDFFGRTFKVDGRALIPRPETELLVEYITKAPLPRKPLILDVGTGSGVIGISLALEMPDSTVVGTDVSAETLELAEENRLLLGAKNFSTVNCNLADGLNRQFDVIAANLPYISSKDIQTLDPVVKDHDPLSALDGGTDGTLLILELVESTPYKMKPGGLMVLETGYDQEISVPSFFSKELWTDIQTHRDLSGNHRLVTARRL
ncbi:MAG: peptide chain release factor N(5)-glutamine methyltransferase [Candidatus Sabulitectum sp.]|nr:peptide chain release factor N(5)-glutamine methyltransferase [Candidatus Sabulitectum sp.]